MIKAELINWIHDESGYKLLKLVESDSHCELATVLMSSENANHIANALAKEQNPMMTIEATDKASENYIAAIEQLDKENDDLIIKNITLNDDLLLSRNSINKLEKEKEELKHKASNAMEFLEGLKDEFKAELKKHKTV